jgi:hypothetical protein
LKLPLPDPTKHEVSDPCSANTHLNDYKKCEWLRQSWSILISLEMSAKPVKGFPPIGNGEFLLEFFEREVNNIMVMDFFWSQFATQFEPDAMQEIDFFWRQPGRVWAQIEDVFLTCWKMNFERQLRFRV